MLKWILVLLATVAAYFAWKNWSTVSAQLNQTLPWFPTSAHSGTIAISRADGSKVEIPVSLSVEAWQERQVAGLRMTLPFALEPIALPMMGPIPKGMQVDAFAGKSRTHEIILAHVVLPTVHGLPPWTYASPMQGTSYGARLQVISKNPATLLNRFRALRTDCVTKEGPQVRYRFLQLERGNETWLLETHAAEDDAAFESSFQKTIFSVQSS